MLPVAVAESIILDLVKPLQETEIITLEQALGRILATPVISNLDFPYWDNSAMDGYAVKFSDVCAASPENPIELTIVSEIPAGIAPTTCIQRGQAARIFTGAMLPDGADTIVIQENTQREGNHVRVLSAATSLGEFVRRKGEFYRAGTPLLNPGIRLTPAEIAVLATVQCTDVNVYRSPRVAIFSTGDELITPHEVLKAGKIVDSNQYALRSFVQSQGAKPLLLGIVADNKQQLSEKMSQAIANADIVLSTGGVSVGEYDYVKEVLMALGATIHLQSVEIKPGKPLTVATFANGCLYFGIPGNPASALVSCWRFVQPALKKLSGELPPWQPSFLKMITRDHLFAGGKRETYIWGKVSLVNGEWEFKLAQGSHSSGNLIGLVQTNALAVLDVDQKAIKAGEKVKVMLVG